MPAAADEQPNRKSASQGDVDPKSIAVLAFKNLSVGGAAKYLHPLYDPVRGDPRFLGKLEEAGMLAEYRET